MVLKWLHFINVRDDEGTAQKEVVDVARKAKEQILKHFPFLEELL
ncbi:thymidylate synthase [Acinetobacter phage Phab24]|nr:thymidylate synthase [Acinetobacter phage Phab24]